MPVKPHIAAALHGLRARLELEAGLGATYALTSGQFDEILSSVRLVLEQSASGATAVVRQSRPQPGPTRAISSRNAPPIATERQPAVSVPSVERIAPPVRPVPPGYVSLVPFRPEPAQPEKDAALAVLREECLHCTGCDLAARRHNVAWGEGNLAADVMFIGEGPGKDEDIEGRPFVGRSGRLLTDIIEKGMKIPRPEVYITNVVKCRPPGNRDPRPDEVTACSRYLDRQIEVIRPKVIVAVGTVAGRTLLGLPQGASGLRGRWHEYNGIPMRIVYHPSYLLRMRKDETDRTSADKQMWQDILTVMEMLKTLS